MRSIRIEVLGVLAVLGVLGVRTDRDVVLAQAPKPIMMTRIYTGADGLSHAEDIPMKLTGKAGESFVAGKLGKRTVGPDQTVIFDKPLVFTKATVDNYHF